MSKTLDEAIETARGALEIDKQVVAPEYRCGYVITEQISRFSDGSGAFRVFSESAWTPQSESMLPWQEPTGTPVHRVNLDGTAVAL